MATDNLVDTHAAETNNIIDKIMIFYMRHNLTLVGLEDLMKLMNANREVCDSFPTQKKKILKMFRENKDMIEILYFIKCAKCGRVSKQNSEIMEQVQCCGVQLVKTETNFFVYMPLRKQIEQSVKKNWKYIKNFSTTNDNSDHISDAHDGNILREILNLYQNDDVNILSLCINVDGANKFNSNFVSLWPVQFIQNYLPPCIRFLPNNILVGGLLYTEGKFNFREFLLPIVNEFNDMKNENIILSIEEIDFFFKPIVTHCAVDLPAKSKFQETQQYNGYDACTYCYHPGEQVVISSKKKKTKKNKIISDSSDPIKCVRYPEGDISYSSRGEHDTLKKMLHAASSKESVDGIKGKVSETFSMKIH